MTKTTFKIELWDINDVIPYAKNAKKHPDDQVKRLAASIKSLGWAQPIVVDANGVVIAGHGRRLAAIELALTKVPVIVRRDLSAAEADALRISDNSTVSTAYDTNMLQEELKRLMDTEGLTFTLDDIGLSEKEKTLLMGDLDIPEIDAIMQDTHDEIENQKSEETKKIEKSDGEEISTNEAFGFKKVRRDDARLLNVFIANAETSTGLSAREAFFARLRELCDE